MAPIRESDFSIGDFKMSAIYGIPPRHSTVYYIKLSRYATKKQLLSAIPRSAGMCIAERCWSLFMIFGEVGINSLIM